MTASEFTKIIGLIKGAFPHIDRFKDDDVKDVWYECLSDLEFDTARVATLNTIKSAKDFPPDIATIREEYANIISAEKKRIGAIRDQYRNAKAEYPGTIEDGYAWEEWLSRVQDERSSVILYGIIKQYIRQCEENNTINSIMDFKECVKTICRDNDKKIFFKEAE